MNTILNSLGTCIVVFLQKKRKKKKVFTNESNVFRLYARVIRLFMFNNIMLPLVIFFNNIVGITCKLG